MKMDMNLYNDNLYYESRFDILQFILIRTKQLIQFFKFTSTAWHQKGRWKLKRLINCRIMHRCKIKECLEAHIPILNE